LPQAASGIAPRQLRAQSPAPQPAPQTRVASSIRGETTTPTPRATPTPSERAAAAGPGKDRARRRDGAPGAEIHLRSERYAKRPSRKFVSASTQEYAWAGYLREWVDRVERVGNLNYPTRHGVAALPARSSSPSRSAATVRSSAPTSSRAAAFRCWTLRAAHRQAGRSPTRPLPRTDENPDILHVTRTLEFPAGWAVDRRVVGLLTGSGEWWLDPASKEFQGPGYDPRD
jgi:protein TonB